MKITVSEAAIGERVDKFLSTETEYTRSYIAKLADEGFLCINGKPAKVNYKLREGDEIELLRKRKQGVRLVGHPVG